jgi:hypothetical protein
MYSSRILLNTIIRIERMRGDNGIPAGGSETNTIIRIERDK